jgi:co-chaperonin GroES (HSP10)
MSNKVKKIKGNRVVLVKPTATQKRDGAFFVPEVSTNVGVVKFIGDEVAESYGLKVGMRVIYLTQHEQVQMENETVFIMEPSNIVAELED